MQHMNTMENYLKQTIQYFMKYYAVGDVLEVFGGWREGRQRKVASVRRWMQSRMFLRFSVLDVDEGRQRKVASVRAGTPSGDTTRTP